MELRSAVLGCCFLTVLQLFVVFANDKAIEKRAITNFASAGKHDVVEGSGSPSPVKNTHLVAADIEWSSGVGPDDEDGDADDSVGSGDGGSGVSPLEKSPSVIVGAKPATTVRPYVTEADFVPDEKNREVEIETRPATTRTTPKIQQLPPSTARTPPSTLFEEGRHAPFDVIFRPGILAAVIGGIVVGILAAILLVMFVVYRMRKKDEGSYALDEPKQPPHYSYAYQKAPTKEFYA